MAKRKQVDAYEVFRKGTAVDRALRLAVRDALLRHKLLGESIVIWRDGKVILVPPEEIIVDPPPRRRATATRRPARNEAIRKKAARKTPRA